MSYGSWKPYVPVAKRRANAQKMAAKARKSGKDVNPVFIEGRTIAKTFWGKAWCDNLESYSDFENRLPRGRTYVRNGSIVDLAIEPGKVRAQVMGSSLYRIEISIAQVEKGRWASLVQECTGTIASLVELLQGTFSKGVMERICHPRSGLFPAPKEISLSCSCPDWATMCKHVAAALYGVGARLDAQPELLFTLRQVEAADLITEAARLPVETKKAPAKGRRLEDDRLEDLFGIEMAEAASPAPAAKTPASRRKTAPPTPEKIKATAKTKKTEKTAKATAAAPAPAAKPPAARRKTAPPTPEKIKATAKTKTTEKTAKATAASPAPAAKPPAPKPRK